MDLRENGNTFFSLKHWRLRTHCSYSGTHNSEWAGWKRLHLFDDDWKPFSFEGLFDLKDLPWISFGRGEGRELVDDNRPQCTKHIASYVMRDALEGLDLVVKQIHEMVRRASFVKRWKGPVLEPVNRSRWVFRLGHCHRHLFKTRYFQNWIQWRFSDRPRPNQKPLKKNFCSLFLCFKKKKDFRMTSKDERLRS